MAREEFAHNSQFNWLRQQDQLNPVLEPSLVSVTRHIRFYEYIRCSRPFLFLVPTEWLCVTEAENNAGGLIVRPIEHPIWGDKDRCYQ